MGPKKCFTLVTAGSAQVEHFDPRAQSGPTILCVYFKRLGPPEW